jgi:hypothetical protein
VSSTLLRAERSSPDKNPLARKLQELRRDHGSDCIFHYSGNDIYCIPLKTDAITIGDPKRFDILTDFQLANVLARSALESFFKGSKKTVLGHKPMYLLLEEHNLASDRQDVFGLFPEYSLDVRPLAPHEGDISSGVLIGFGIRLSFSGP